MDHPAPLTITLTPKLLHIHTTVREDLYSVVVPIGNKHISSGVKGNAIWSDKLAIACT